jgi:hypothetical protein
MDIPGVPARITDHLTVRPNGCWTWGRAHKTTGYACVWWEGQQRGLHRVLYELVRGPVPDGMYLDHVVCDDRSCPNPWHVEPTTNAANMHRTVRERMAARGTCKHGHDDWKVKASGKRYCAECARIEARERMRRGRERSARR